MKNPSSKLTRMRLDLEEYDFEIKYIKGKNNVTADALSRIDFKEIQQLTNKEYSIAKMTTISETKKLIKNVELELDKNNVTSQNNETQEE